MPTSIIVVVYTVRPLGLPDFLVIVKSLDLPGKHCKVLDLDLDSTGKIGSFPPAYLLNKTCLEPGFYRENR